MSGEAIDAGEVQVDNIEVRAATGEIVAASVKLGGEWCRLGVDAIEDHGLSRAVLGALALYKRRA